MWLQQRGTRRTGHCREHAVHKQTHMWDGQRSVQHHVVLAAISSVTDSANPPLNKFDMSSPNTPIIILSYFRSIGNVMLPWIQLVSCKLHLESCFLVYTCFYSWQHLKYAELAMRRSCVQCGHRCTASCHWVLWYWRKLKDIMILRQVWSLGGLYGLFFAKQCKSHWI